MVNHKVLLLDTGYSLYRLMQQNPTLREEFELLGLDFSDEVRVSDRSRLIEQISASVRSCQLVLLVAAGKGNPCAGLQQTAAPK